MSAPMMTKLLSFSKFWAIFTLFFILNDVIICHSHSYHEFLLCRQCGREILELEDVVNMPSELALTRTNKTVGHKQGILIQRFKNPHGHTYDVVTASKADVYKASKETGGDTWWPGFNWVILGCPQCKQHIGWEYIPQDKSNPDLKSFFGLVMNNLLYENEADNLIVIPKSYTS